VSARPPLRPLDEALAELLGRAVALRGVERIPTIEADGRVLAEDLVSPLQVPPQDNSSMDDYAVRRAEIPDEGVVLPVSQRIPAGHEAGPLQPAGPHQQRQEDEEQQPLGEGLVKLARMARQRPATRKHHRPGHIRRRPAPELGIDEIGEWRP